VVQHQDELYRVKVEGNSVVEVLFEFEGLNIQLHDEFKALPQLCKLVLTKLPKLREIWRKVPPHFQCFYLLERLEVEECNSLTYLFTTSMAKALVGLRRIYVSKCNNLESVVSEDEENESPVEQSVLFSHLQKLELKNLPKLSTLAPLTYRLKTSYLALSYAGILTFADISKQVFITKDLTIVGGMEKMTTFFQGTEISDLKRIIIEDCAQVEQLFDLHHCSSKPLPDLENITLKRLPQLTSVWKSAPGAILDIQKLKHLRIEGCNSLRHLITSSQVNSFVNLFRLRVTDCSSFEAIVVEEEAEKEVKQVNLFPSLQIVTLQNLPKLLTRLPEHYTFGSPECQFKVDDGLLELLK
jgi:hypothetical protein